MTMDKNTILAFRMAQRDEKVQWASIRGKKKHNNTINVEVTEQICLVYICSEKPRKGDRENERNIHI